MTETVPEKDDLIARLCSFDYFGRSRKEQDAADALCREAATALEAAHARIVLLEERVETLKDAYDILGEFNKTARREALEEAAKVNWVEAPYVPREWEGRQAWKYVDIANIPFRRVTLDMVPHDYSRDEDHCGGVWFALFTPPAPPPCALMEKPNENG